MPRPSIAFVFALVLAGAVFAECEISTPKPKTSTVPTGRALVKDVILANDITSFTLRSEYIEPENDPDHILPKKWAQQIGYVPVGIASPAMALWYNQGFFQWTFDGESLHLYRPRVRVVRASGADAVVEYRWDMPKAEVSVRFAVVEGFDKLVMLGRWIPKGKLTSVKLKFMAYPSTFAKPHNRCVTTALGTRRTDSFKLDLSKEKWILLEDDTENRPMAGPAGMLLGDVSAFQSVTATGVGGYGEYVNIEMAPGRTSFALAFHEMPETPGIAENRANFQLAGDAESAALAKLAAADWNRPLTLPPGDPERVREIRRRRRAIAAARLSRDAEKWSAAPKPAKGTFLWFSKIPGGPVKIALLCPRSAAWESTRLASRLDLDVRHLYFDSHTAICASNAWPYRSQTGDGPLGVRLATQVAKEICSDPSREVILVSHLSGKVIPQQVRKAILKAVAKGAGLYLAGDQKMLEGWPGELWDRPDKVLVSSVLAAFPWEKFPGLRPGERGRIGDAPLRAFRHGAGRVVVWQAKVGRYSTFSPLTKASEGLDGGFDRILGMNAAALLVAAGRPLPLQASLTRQIPPMRGFRLRWTGPRPATVAFRIQNDLDEVVFEGEFKPASFPSFPERFPSGRRYFVEAILKNLRGDAVGFTATSFESSGAPSIESIGFPADRKVHAESVPMIELPVGGALTTSIRTAGAKGCRLRAEVRDAFDRLLAASSTLVRADTTNIDLALSRPLTVCHRLDVSLSRGGAENARERQRFTLPLEYPLDDFTYLMWSYARGEPVTRFVQRRCFELGSDMMDLCHMRGYDDSSAAREYAVAARSGLRLLPYITRVAGTANEDHTLSPGLHSQSWFDRQRDSMKICTRQAVAYAPVAYTLGDENYMRRTAGPEIGMSVETMTAYRAWLQIKYGVVADLNAAWGSAYAEFAAITEPVWLPDVAERTDSFASWFDHRLFLDEAFVALHERLAEVVRDVQPGARVGWDGPLSYHWKTGYDFAKWCENLELNQVYTTHWLQGELVRSFAGQGSLRGEWGNAIADDEAGFRAIAWHNLFRQHNSCWWWTSWGCDYTPFNPDGTQTRYGKWYFDEARELRGGIGKLLLGSRRSDSGVAILYSQADHFASALAKHLAPKAPYGDWVRNLEAAGRVVEDCGLQFRFVTRGSLNAEGLRGYRALVLPLATCLSDGDIATLRNFAEKGGTLIVDGRLGLLTESGGIRAQRPFADILGMAPTAGIQAFKAVEPLRKVDMGGEAMELPALDPGPLFTSVPLGEGRIIRTNLAFRRIAAGRDTKEGRSLAKRLASLLREAGLPPPATLSPVPVCVEQTLFQQDAARYLCLQQDIHQRGLAAQRFAITIAEPGFVYDSRAGMLLSDRRLGSWDTEISRGRPRVFAILPYRVSTLEFSCAGTGKLGEASPFTIKIGSREGTVGHHVVHLSVFAPGSAVEHRLYSANIDCASGIGRGTIPFAINDSRGEWRLELRDAATGVRAMHTLLVRP